MAPRLPPHFLDLVQDALLKSFWTKKALRTFLRRSHVAESFLAQLPPDETKREWLDRLFPKLEASERGQILVQQMARSLADQSTFPDLDNWEDSAQKIRTAQTAVLALRDCLQQKDDEREREKEATRIRELAADERQRNIAPRPTLPD